MASRSLNKLTDQKIRSLVKAGDKTAVSDGRGLTLTISASGYAAWVLRYRFNGQQKEVTIGRLDDFSLTVAREQRTKLRQMLAEGIDPARQKISDTAWVLHYQFGGQQKEVTIGGLDDFSLAVAREQQAKLKQMLAQGIDPARQMISDQAAQAATSEAAKNFEQLARLWFENTQKPRLENPQVVERVLRIHLNPVFGKMALSDIKPAHIIGCIEQIIAKGSPTVANDARRHLQKIFDYGLVRGDIDVNPAAQITHQIVGHDEQSRDRNLSLAEIKTLYHTINKGRDWFGRNNEITIHLLLMLGVRKSELIKAKWTELDLDQALWTIPISRIKTRRKEGAKDFVIALPTQAVELFSELQVQACGSDWVLPSRRRGVRKLGHISGDTINRITDELDHGLDAFTIHDLRRTMRSHLSEIGIPFAIAERCLNHKLPGQGEIDDRHDFLDARLSAVQRWCDVLDVLTDEGVTAASEFISGADVIDLRLIA